MTSFRTLRPEQSAEWIDVLHRCFQHDFYLLPQYHDLAERNGEGEARLFVCEEGPHVIAVPLLIRDLRDVSSLHAATTWRDATSVYGYAGPVASSAELSPDMLSRFRSKLTEALQELNVVSLFSRLHPMIPQAQWLSGLGICHVTQETVSIDLSLSPEAQRARYRRSHKESINRLRRQGIQCLHDEKLLYLGDFVALYHETMTRVGARPWFFFTRAQIEDLIEALQGKFKLFVCKLGDRVLCAATFVACDGILQYYLGGTWNEFLEMAPMKLLMDDVRIWATRQQLKVFHLGGGATARSDDSLLYFKHGFSDRRHQFLTWRWIVDAEAETALFEERRRLAELKQETLDEGFFPRYRAPVTPMRSS
jgi:hypothetical protein